MSSKSKTSPKKNALKPVKLSASFIKEILSEIHVRGIGKSGVQLTRKVIQEKLFDHLTKVKLVDLPEARAKFKAEIIRQYNATAIPHGEPAGYSAAFAVGGPLTQMSLNSFHFAGTESGLEGVFGRVKAMLMGSELNKNPTTTVFFKDPNTGDYLHDAVHYKETLQTIIARRGEIEETSISDLVLETNFLNDVEKELMGFERLLELHKQLRPNHFGIKAFKGLNVLAVTLDTYRMYTHRITMQDVCTAFEGLADDRVASDLACLWKSQRDGVIYIVANEDKGNLNDPLKNTIFLDFLVKYVFQTIYLKGIPKILSMEPMSVNTDSIIRDFKYKKAAKTLQVRVKLWDSRVAGPSLADLSHLMNTAGIPTRVPEPVVETSPMLEISMSELKAYPQFKGVTDSNVVSKVYNYYKSFKTEVAETEAADLTEQQKQFKEASVIWYGKAKGVNLDEILWRDDVDSYRTYPNDMHLITQRIGIEAARAYVIREFIKTLSGSYINPKHILLIYDVLTNLGEITPMTLTGLNRRSVGTLSAAATANAISMIANGSIQGQKDTATTVSASICLGIAARLGTGAVGTVHNNDYVAGIPPIPAVDDSIVTQLQNITLGKSIFNDFTLATLLNRDEQRSNEPFVKPVPVISNKNEIPTESVTSTRIPLNSNTPQLESLNRLVNEEGYTEPRDDDFEIPVTQTVVQPLESSYLPKVSADLAYVLAGPLIAERRIVNPLDLVLELPKPRKPRVPNLTNLEIVKLGPASIRAKRNVVRPDPL